MGGGDASEWMLGEWVMRHWGAVADAAPHAVMIVVNVVNGVTFTTVLTRRHCDHGSAVVKWHSCHTIPSSLHGGYSRRG